jgi:hypothetical protein
MDDSSAIGTIGRYYLDAASVAGIASLNERDLSDVSILQRQTRTSETLVPRKENSLGPEENSGPRLQVPSV